MKIGLALKKNVIEPKNALKKCTKNALILLELTAAVQAKNSKKIFLPWQPVTTISIISNKEIEDTMKTVKLFEVSGLTKKVLVN